MPDRPVFYFAYGSNCDPDRFRARVGPWRSRRRGWLDGWRLRFAASVQSEGGGGAVLDRAGGEAVAGVLFEIGSGQLEALDRVEFAADRDRSGAGRREEAPVRTEDGAVTATFYTVTDDGACAAPSARYLGHILDGLRDAGHAEEALRAVRDAADRATSRAFPAGPRGPLDV